MDTASGARAPLTPSWLILALNKAKLIQHLEKAELWQRYHNCSLEDLSHSTRGDDRHRDMAYFLHLDKFDAEELKDAIMTLHDKNLDVPGSSIANKIKEEIVDLSGGADLIASLDTLPDADPPKLPPTPQEDQDGSLPEAVCSTVKVETVDKSRLSKKRSRSPSRKRIKVAIKTSHVEPPVRSEVCSTHGKTRALHNLCKVKGEWVCKSTCICVLSKGDLARQTSKKVSRDKVDTSPAEPTLSNEAICRHISREARKGKYVNVGGGFFALSDVMPWANSQGLSRKIVVHALKDMVFQSISSRGSTLRYNFEQDSARREIYIRLAPACKEL